MNVCVPVLKRYDLLRKLLQSLESSTIRPVVYIMDNGMQQERLTKAIDKITLSVATCVPPRSLGVAESWNWFLRQVPEERLIVNDDIEFAQTSIEQMLKSKAPFVSCSYGFSCFIIRDSCIDAVGLFDETISPGYAYFEDMDYLRRMKVAGIRDEVVLCDVKHMQSGTPQAFSEEEWQLHHKKFLLAQENYTKKWAGGPSWDQLAEIGGQGAHVD